MALRGHSAQATLISLNGPWPSVVWFSAGLRRDGEEDVPENSGYDPYRLYYDIPVSGPR